MFPLRINGLRLPVTGIISLVDREWMVRNLGLHFSLGRAANCSVQFRRLRKACLRGWAR